MEWIIEDNSNSKPVQTIVDIATAVRDVMKGEIEFMILTPPAPIRTSNFMQAALADGKNIHLEVSFVQPSGANRLYYTECSPDLAICLLTLYYTEYAVPEISDLTFEGEYGG